MQDSAKRFPTPAELEASEKRMTEVVHDAMSEKGVEPVEQSPTMRRPSYKTLRDLHARGIIPFVHNGPSAKHWLELDTSHVPVVDGCLSLGMWQQGPTRVISAVQKDPEGTHSLHLFVQHFVNGRASLPSAEKALKARRAFGFGNASPGDTAYDGMALHYWLPCSAP